MWRRTVDCLGVAVGISSQVAELEAPLSSVFATYADAEGPPDLEYELVSADRPTLRRGGQVARSCPVAIDLVAVLELDLYREVMRRARGLLLHAGAVVGANGAALVFAGRSGAGKSTLVRALLGRGFAYLSEECVALEASGSCRGLARALHVDDDALALPAGFRAGEYPIRREEGVRITRLFHPPEQAIWRGIARTAAVVSIEHASDVAPALTPLGGGESLSRLWPAVFRPDPSALAEAGPALEGVARYHLTTATPDQAIERAVALGADLGVHPR